MKIENDQDPCYAHNLCPKSLLTKTIYLFSIRACFKVTFGCYPSLSGCRNPVRNGSKFPLSTRRILCKRIVWKEKVRRLSLSLSLSLCLSLSVSLSLNLANVRNFDYGIVCRLILTSGRVTQKCPSVENCIIPLIHHREEPSLRLAHQ